MGVAGDGAGEDVIVVGIALDHRSGKWLGCDGLGQALVVLQELDSGDSGDAALPAREDGRGPYWCQRRSAS